MTLGWGETPTSKRRFGYESFAWVHYGYSNAIWLWSLWLSSIWLFKVNNFGDSWEKEKISGGRWLGLNLGWRNLGGSPKIPRGCTVWGWMRINTSKGVFQNCTGWSIGSGERWVYGGAIDWRRAFCLKFPSHFDIAQNKDIKVKDVYLGSGTWAVDLTRNLNDWEVDDHMGLLNMLFQVVISDGSKEETIGFWVLRHSSQSNHNTFISYQNGGGDWGFFFRWNKSIRPILMCQRQESVTHL